PCRAGPLEAVQHDEQFHQVLIDRRTRWLNQEDIATEHVLLDAYRDFAVWEIGQGHLAERVSEHVGNVLREPDVGPTAKDLEPIVVVHGPPGDRFLAEGRARSRRWQSLPRS